MAEKQDAVMREVVEAVKIIGGNWKMFIKVTAPLILLVWCLFLSCWLIGHSRYRWASFTAWVISTMLITMLSSCSVVFTFGYVYSSPKEMTFRKVIVAAPRIICRNLVHTFLYLLLGFGIYLIFDIVIDVIFGILMKSVSVSRSVENLLAAMLGIVVAAEFGIIGTTCQLASVVTVLEGVGGIEALKRSWNNMGDGYVICCCVLTACLYSLAFMSFYRGMELVRLGSYEMRILAMEGLWQLLFIIHICLYLLMSVCCYFVKKACNLETIDKSMLAALLDSYLEQEQHLTGRGGQLVQMEEVVSPV